jgi:DNA mismatch endonuclease (patch repair protein)
MEGTSRSRTSGSHLRSVKSKNTTPEIIVRKALWGIGLRYRIHYSKLPGKPDIAFTKNKIAVFVHGCYWHRHGCPRSFNPKSNSKFWQDKFFRNVERDTRNETLLIELGWKVVILWECEIRQDLDSCINRVTQLLALAKTTPPR